MSAITKKVAVYLGSSTDLPPALLYPEYDWVFITSDGSGYWPATDPLETRGGFMQDLASQLPMGGRVSNNENTIRCQRADGSLIATVYYASKFPNLCTASRQSIADANVIWMSGWALDENQRLALRSICPRLDTCFVDGSTFQSRLLDLTCVEVPEYFRNARRSLQLFYGGDFDFVARAVCAGWTCSVRN